MAARGKPVELTMEGVQIRFRNFTGKETPMNAKGKRNFLALIPTDELAAKMEADGWRVKYLKPREEGDPPQPFLKVNVNIDSDYPPRFVYITQRGKTTLDATEESMMMLDYSNVTVADLIISQYSWEVRGEKGITAYLRNGYFTVTENDLDLKYADTPDVQSAKSSIQFEPNDDFGPAY